MILKVGIRRARGGEGRSESVFGIGWGDVVDE